MWPMDSGQEKEMKGIYLGKNIVKLSLHIKIIRWYDSLCGELPGADILHIECSTFTA